MVDRSTTDFIPEHLRPYIAVQDASLYTPMDHAAWRFILKISQRFFIEHAHQKYIDGLEETGISTERIPLISEMDSKLRRFGWRAVAVSGFIPPAVFMEFQALGILPIACEMRTLDHLAYTPAPDIVHEAAGHAPILADPEYAHYLRAYGEVARKAIYSAKDMELYEAILALSDTKEDPASSPLQIELCQKKLEERIAALDYVSEATYLARMFWWTAEYGLVGRTQAPKIYGAGLLSSVGESYACLKEEVRKLPLTLDCVNMSYDITRPQPQLFVVSNFPALIEILERFEASMAFRRGGVEGLVKAKTAGTLTTTVLDSGLQISGVLSDFWLNAHGGVEWVRYSGPCQLAVGDQELSGQGVGRHPAGFSAPLGRPSGLERLRVGGTLKLSYESGIELEGTVVSDHRPHFISFDRTTVRRGGALLYSPDWGPFDLILGEEVCSVFGGAADRGAYLRAVGGFEQKPRRPKTNLTEKNRPLNLLYQAVRSRRESGVAMTADFVRPILEQLRQDYPSDWLLRFELLELVGAGGVEPPWAAEVRRELQRVSAEDPGVGELLERGYQTL